ncbi:NAD-dependent dehydratase, partial [Streptomyces cyaneofuscatus]
MWPSPRPAAAPSAVISSTGAATGVGELLTARLAASDEVKQVIAIDERRG